MEKSKGNNCAYLVNTALIGGLVVFVLAGWLLVLDFFHIAWLKPGLSATTKDKALYSLILAFMVLLALTFRNLRSKFDRKALLTAFIICFAFLGLRAHRYIFYWDWDRSCAAGQPIACWGLANAHRDENGFGMHEELSAHYEELTCEYKLELGCSAMIRRGVREFSRAQCEVMNRHCKASGHKLDEHSSLMCQAFEAHCVAHPTRRPD